MNGPALASAAALRQIIENFVNQETQQRPERFVTLFSSSVRRSIKGVCGFTLRHNRLEAALHGTGGQTIWVFLCDSRSTPADSIRHLSLFVLGVTGMIFIVVFSLLTYVVVKFRSRAADTEHEPAQVYGSTQIEIAWTIIPVLIVVVLFLATARVIHAIQDAPKPAEAVEITAI